jgi:hypothetical protein
MLQHTQNMKRCDCATMTEAQCGQILQSEQYWYATGRSYEAADVF